MVRLHTGVSIGVALPARDAGETDNLVETLIERTAQAAAAGLRSAWFPQIMDVDAITMAALAGRAVPEIAVGTYVVPIYPRHPLLIGGAAQTAQAATGGRFTLGVGLGAQNVQEPAFGVPYPPPIQNLREQLTVLREVLAGAQVDYAGKLVTARPPLPTRVPGAQPPVPLHVAAMGPQALKVTGELADGTMPYLAGPRALGEFIVPSITTAAERAGRPAPAVIAAVPALVTGRVDEARERSAEQLAFYDTIPSYQRVIEREGASRALDLALIGDEETVAAGLRRYLDAGATELVLVNTGLNGEQDRLRTWRLAGELARSFH